MESAQMYTVVLNAIFGEKSDWETVKAASPELIAQLDNTLETLNNAEYTLIRERFGLDDGEAKLMEDISKILNKTEEECREIESVAFSKLRNPARSQGLREYLD
jgi:DNA-directed RNA polymerase sigma subunit (sigma70/sigma32)